MKKHILKHYPVDNGDTTLITLSSEMTILIDCKIRSGEENSSGNKIFDVKGDLLKSLKKREEKPFLDLFILTHPDQDHCLGTIQNFYLGDPDNYKDSNLDNDEIIIDELWCTSMLFGDVSNDDAKALKKEAERRRKLWDNNDSEKENAGNRIRLIGYNGDKKFDNVPNSIPGEIVSEINNRDQDNFEFFVHSPFKKSLITATAEDDKNFSSIVLQARFKINSWDHEWKCLYLFGGDADHNIWQEVINKSKSYDNEDKLNWDFFLSPHHCSWTYFNNVPYAKSEENKKAKESSLELLDYKNSGGKVIASCRVIKNNDINPPHYQAKQKYLTKLDSSDDFIELANTPSKSAPEPLIHEITSEGISKKEFITEDDKSSLTLLARKAPKPWCNE